MSEANGNPQAATAPTILVGLRHAASEQLLLKADLLTPFADAGVRVVIVAPNPEDAEELVAAAPGGQAPDVVALAPEDAGGERILARVRRALLRGAPPHAAEGFLVRALAGIVRTSPRLRMRLLAIELSRDNDAGSAPDEVIDRFRPGAVLTLGAGWRGSEARLLRAGQRRGIHTAAIVTADDEDRLSVYRGADPDRYIVFNETVSEDLVAVQDVSPNRIFVAGAGGPFAPIDARAGYRAAAYILKKMQVEPPVERLPEGGSAALICHCRQVPYATVEACVEAGARSLADVQRNTTACTRCFGCRWEIENLLEAKLGDEFQHSATVLLPDELTPKSLGVTKSGDKILPRRMYMPILHGYRGSDVHTRVIVCNWPDSEEASQPITVRADLLSMNGDRLGVWSGTVRPHCSAVIEPAELDSKGTLAKEGAGCLKFVVEADQIGSMRPYFQFVTPEGISSTHEKRAPRKPKDKPTNRRYHWVVPLAGAESGDEAYVWITNVEFAPMDHRVVLETIDGAERSASVGRVELDQSVCVPLHDEFPEILNGFPGGSVRLEPLTHAISGFVIRRQKGTELWRVQHL